MGAIDLLMNEVERRYRLSDTKASSLLSGLLSLITHQSGGISGFIDRFRNAGLGDVVSSWFSGTTRNLTNDQVESVLGSGCADQSCIQGGDLDDNRSIRGCVDASQSHAEHCPIGRSPDAIAG